MRFLGDFFLHPYKYLRNIYGVSLGISPDFRGPTVGWDVGVHPYRSPLSLDGDSPPMQVTFSGPGLNSFIESQKQVGIFKKHQNNPRASMVAWYIYRYTYMKTMKIKKGLYGKYTVQPWILWETNKWMLWE